MASHLSADLRAFAQRWLPPTPARILDVGCGDGESTRWLTESGWDALGVDPDAPDEARFLRARIQDLAAADPFDAALAIRSLHHVGGLEAAVDSLASALRPGARLVVFEYAIEAIDERALRWNAQHGLPAPTNRGSASDVTPLGEVREALGRRFLTLADDPAPYLCREAGRPELEPAELGAIASGLLPAAGVRLAYERS